MKTKKSVEDALRAALLEARGVIRLCDPNGDRVRAFGATLPEDPFVRSLCQQLGYGAVMDSAARQWRLNGHPGGSFTVGPSVAVVQQAVKMIDDALMVPKPRTKKGKR